MASHACVAHCCSSKMVNYVVGEKVATDGSVMKTFKSCGVLIYRTRAAGCRCDPLAACEVLLLKKHNGDLDVPKGHMEKGETEVQTALRELKEETGIERELITLDGIFRYETVYHPVYKRLGGELVEKTLVVFMGRLNDGEIEPCNMDAVRSEHESFLWWPMFVSSSPPSLVPGTCPRVPPASTAVLLPAPASAPPADTAAAAHRKARPSLSRTARAIEPLLQSARLHLRNTANNNGNSNGTNNNATK
eukprot:TRINITY_DN18325_c0_g1_i1.p1 TRINITY_DN18325_c0_g1~~TRINITY_DN18325_c0_g1_i1.p1  ORF type:complete len:258 (+),score=65.26 TRINITY_DN18325_c0_g1_i1:33-776(+)